MDKVVRKKRSEALAENLHALGELLTDGRLKTATQIGIELGCTIPTVNVRLKKLREVLKKKNCDFIMHPVHEGRRGPNSVAYALPSNNKIQKILKDLAAYEASPA